MANTFFKSFSESDRTSSRTLLHENIPITGTLISGSYTNSGATAQKNIKSFSHGMFKSVYDYPFLSSSANHIFDVTYGAVQSSSADVYESSGKGTAWAPDKAVWLSTTGLSQEEKKHNMYMQMSQVLVGFDTDGDHRLFDFDGDLSAGTKFTSAVFINLSRLLVKDEIKKGSFKMSFGTHSSYATPFTSKVTVSDGHGDSKYFTNSPAGEYGILYQDGDTANDPRGLIFYQAGIAVLPVGSSLFGGASTVAWRHGGGADNQKQNTLVSGTIDQISDAFIRRIDNIQFNNTTELNSTIYFCRANHNEFNYSSNPTYLSGSKIVVKADNVLAPPRSYVTTVGLYAADNELLAVAKLSEPLRKDPTNELTLRVRLDY